MASSSSVDHPHVTLEVVEEKYPYPYPTNLSATSFTSVKLSGRDEYDMWKTQMLCLYMLGFINGTLVRPQTSASGKEKVGEHQTRRRLWRRSDALVKGWILGSLSKQTFRYVLNRLTEKVHPHTDAEFSAKDVWDELKTIYGPAVLPQLQINSPTVLSQVPVADKQRREEEEGRAVIHQELNEATLSGYWNWVVNILRKNKVTVIEEVTYNGNTALHVAVGTAKKPDFLLKMLKWTPQNIDLSAVKNSDGSTLLHVAAIVGNIEAAKILVAASPDLLLAQNQKGHTPLAIALSNMDTKMSQFLLQHIINDDTRKATLFSGTSGDELLVTVICSKDFRLARDLVKHYETLHTDTVLMAVAQNFRELNTTNRHPLPKLPLTNNK